MAETASYAPDFFHRHQEGSRRSALRILPHVIDLVNPTSIVDVGCGVGTWLAAARVLGVEDVVGLDGAYVKPHMLQIPPERFQPADLSQPFACGRTFDLALSLEVGEHLPPASASGFLESLTRLAPIVLFSAAIPQQPGERHVNLQWPEWWIEEFSRHHFVAVDCIRRRIWDDESVEWWYAQNAFLMVREDRLASLPRLAEERRRATWPYRVVHPRAYLERVAMAEALAPAGVRAWLSLGPQMVRVTAARMWQRLGLTSRV